jgi:hypothetical protein
MIPFNRCFPYERFSDDIYVASCPCCGADNVLLPLKPSHLEDVQGGKKKLLVFPCCRNRLTIVDADRDYLLTDRELR